MENVKGKFVIMFKIYVKKYRKQLLHFAQKVSLKIDFFLTPFWHENTSQSFVTTNKYITHTHTQNTII